MQSVAPQQPRHDGERDPTWRTLVGSQALPPRLCSLALDSRAGPRLRGQEPPCLACSKAFSSGSPSGGVGSPSWRPQTRVNAAADTRQGQQRWGHPQCKGMPLRQARWKEQHLEQIPLTEICPRSKIISENPNGLSLATHQTATCVRNV